MASSEVEHSPQDTNNIADLVERAAETLQKTEISAEKKEVFDVKPKYALTSNNMSAQDKISIEKSQEATLRSKFPQMQSGRSAFLNKRLSKGRVYFDSGEYQMGKAKKDGPGPSSLAKKPENSDTKSEDTPSAEVPSETSDTTTDESLQYGDKDHPRPEPEETAQQAIPTPELLFLRRVSLHMPKSSEPAGFESGPGPHPAGIERRRCTAAPKALLPPSENPAFPAVFETNELPAELMARSAKRRSTLQIPSKLTLT